MRVAILGTGFAAEIHSKTLRVVAPDVVRWYASRDGARGAALAARFGGAGHFAGYEAAIENRDIDTVLVALPPALHREWTLRALAAGKHVIVEKPPFLTTAAFDEVSAAAAAASRLLMVAENYFYKPLTGLLKLAVDRGELGDVLIIQLNALKRQNSAGWRDDDRLAGGGALFEGGIHWVSLLANIGLTPQRIRAAFPHAEARRAGRAGGAGKPGGEEQVLTPPERSAVVTIDYAEGAVATLSYSWDLPSIINGVRISRVFGTGGTMRFESNGVAVWQTGRRRRLAWPGLVDLAGYRAMMADFVAAIEQNRPPRYNLTLARRDLQLVEEAYASRLDPGHP